LPAPPDDIDARYGLEPVLEPNAHAELSGWAEFPCPYCGEVLGTKIDLTDRSRTYIEDCQVCCQPMQLRVSVDRRGRLRSARAKRLDE
jgi:hypothetical protein